VGVKKPERLFDEVVYNFNLEIIIQPKQRLQVGQPGFHSRQISLLFSYTPPKRFSFLAELSQMSEVRGARGKYCECYGVYSVNNILPKRNKEIRHLRTFLH